jgi:hypothetical protein
MKKIACVILMTLALSSSGLADESVFNVKLADAKGSQANAQLILSDTSKSLDVRVADRDVVTVPYDNVDKFSYEYSKKHRITQGAIVMVASLGVGAVVMLTKSKSHWLYIDFHEQNAPKTVVLRMDKKNYKDICQSIKTHTGKDVLMLGDEKANSKKAQPEKQDKPETAH